MRNNKILIIDDSNLVIKLVKKALLTNGINGYKFTENSIITASNGFSAIEEFSKPHHIEFVITDVNMPDINGDEIIEVLEDTQKLKDTKVIFITTKNIAKDISKAILKKSMGVIYKPFNNITFSNQFNSLLSKKNRHDIIIKKIQQKQVKQKEIILDILTMFFKKEQATLLLKKDINEVLEEYITVDEDVNDNELAFVAYHVATELISKHNLDLDFRLKSFECAFYRKLNNFGDFSSDEFFNLHKKFENNISKVKSLDNHTDIIKILFSNIDILLVRLSKQIALFPPKKVDMFYPYFDDIVSEFSKHDCMYQDKTIVTFFKNLEELISFKDYITEFKSKKTLYKELPIATKVFMRCETSFSTIVFKIERIIPYYVGWINMYLWKRFFDLKIFNNYVGTDLSNRSPNLQNILLKNKKITISEHKKYKNEKIIVISKNLEILTFFKKKLERKLEEDYSFHIFPTIKHLDVWVKTNKVDRIIIDYDINTDVFNNALDALSYFKNIDSCFNAFFMQRLYLIIEDDKMDEILEKREKYSDIHILKTSNLKEDFLIKKLFTS